MGDEVHRSLPSGGGKGKVGTILESAQVEWTDEKHNMYLNSVEETFINQLYNCDWISRTQKDRRPSGSNSNNLCTNHIKIQRRGYRENLRLESACIKTETDNGSHILSSHAAADYGGSSSSKQSPACFIDMYSQDTIGSTIEVSDQNFGDECDRDKGRVKVCYRRNKGWKH